MTVMTATTRMTKIDTKILIRVMNPLTDCTASQYKHTYDIIIIISIAPTTFVIYLY